MLTVTLSNLANSNIALANLFNGSVIPLSR